MGCYSREASNVQQDLPKKLYKYCIPGEYLVSLPCCFQKREHTRLLTIKINGSILKCS